MSLAEEARAGDVEASRQLAMDGHAWEAADGSMMVHVPAGDFLCGPEARRESIGDFAMAMHPVTNAQYARFVDATGYTPDEAHPLSERYLAHWSEGGFAAVAEHPVTHVSWVDARHYCQWAELVIPTEKMWEKAARGEDGRPYPWGWASPITYAREDRRRVRAWHPHVGKPTTTHVGWNPKLRTAWGCQDMIGNVSEICESNDRSEGDYRVLDEELRAALIHLRGSAFLRISADRGRMTCAHRRRLRTTGRNRWVGFRPAFVFKRTKPA